MSSITWKKVTVRVPLNMEDAVSDFFATLTGRGVCSREEGGTVLVDVFLDAVSAGEQLSSIERFIEDLAGHGDLPGETKIQVVEVPEEDWMAVFRSQHGPVRISERMVVRPAWCDPVGPGDMVIDPGMAFGTGTHATTSMCLELLDELADIRPPVRMFDLGTGSGILAIAGAMMGIRNVLAVDIDPVVVKVAGENIRSNQVEGIVRVEEGGVERAGAAYDVITANLSGSLLVSLAGEIVKYVAPSGSLIVSGITDGEKEKVLEAFTHYGLYAARVMEEDGWVAIRLEKK